MECAELTASTAREATERQSGDAVALHFKAGTAFAPFQRFPAIKYNDLLYLTTGILHVTTGLRGVRFSQNCPAPVIALYRWNGSLKHRSNTLDDWMRKSGTLRHLVQRISRKAAPMLPQRRGRRFHFIQRLRTTNGPDRRLSPLIKYNKFTF